MPREYESSSYSIVLLGNFNPSIFSPAWFGRYGLLTDEEVAAASVNIIHPDITEFTADWLFLHVERGRFQAQCKISSIQIRDFVLKTFQDYLSHTPVHSLGINREAHYKLPSAEHQMRLGRAMAPLEPWAEWGKEIESSKAPGGMTSLTMLEYVNDRPKGHFQINIQPSSIIPRKTGVYFVVNDHYEVASREALTGCEEMMEQLDINFEKSVERTDRILDQILEKAEN